MKKFMGGSSAKINQNLKYQIKAHNQLDADGQDFSGESRRLKKILKRAVNREVAPQSLIDSIRKGIRR